MEKYNIVFCDDDEIFLDVISDKFVTYFDSKSVNLYKLKSLKDLFEFNQKYKINTLFLDYDFKKENSFNYLEANGLDYNVRLIIVSFYENIIFESFKYNIFWFIRKSHFDKDFEHLIPNLKRELASDKQNNVIFKDKNKVLVLNKNDIILIEIGNKNNLIIYEKKEYTIRATFKSIIPIFINDINYIMPTYGKFVNCKYIKFFNYSKMILETSTGNIIPISRSLRKDVEKRYGEYLCRQ